MKQSKSPTLPPNKTNKAVKAAPKASLPLPVEEASGWQTFGWPLKLLGTLALMVGFVVLVTVLWPPEQRQDRAQLERARGTALASTGFTPPPTAVPGSAFGVDLALFGARNYAPALQGEKITFIIVNTRQTSLYVSNCDGILLQRFVGTGNPQEPKQMNNQDNWETIAPGGFRNCGPLSGGGQARRVEPGAKADASFDFKSTQPYPNKSWDTPGAYRLLMVYYMRCPSSSDKIADCLDKNSAPSNPFQFVDPGTLDVSTPVPGASPVPAPTARP